MGDESPIEKENLNFEEKSPNLDFYGLNWIFMDLIGFFMDLIGFLFEFIEDLIARKLIFKSIWALIWRNLSSEAKIYFLGIYWVKSGAQLHKY